MKFAIKPIDSLTEDRELHLKIKITCHDFLLLTLQITSFEVKKERYSSVFVTSKVIRPLFAIGKIESENYTTQEICGIYSLSAN